MSHHRRATLQTARKSAVGTVSTRSPGISMKRKMRNVVERQRSTYQRAMNVDLDDEMWTGPDGKSVLCTEYAVGPRRKTRICFTLTSFKS